MMQDIRVRFAPSPTGFLHIGGLRTALFNFLFARKRGGAFILRFEDTDRSRYVEGAEQDIIDNLRWLGIDWDEGPDAGGTAGPYVQSERCALYNEYAAQLEASGMAYRCYCTAERLEAMRSEQEKQGMPTRYDRHCLGLSEEEKAALPADSSVLRFRFPQDGSTVFLDVLRGEVSIDNTQQDDFILMKSDGFPTYHFANVVDDHLMKISHVLRGEEWISSTPKHAQLYSAFGWKPPEFVHLPVIRSPHGGKLSKRDGATSVRDFKIKGYLPEAMLNFLVLLGWSYDGETSMFTMQELQKIFDIDKIGLGAPVYDVARLDDYNGKYIREKNMEELFTLTAPLLEAAGLMRREEPADAAYLRSILPLLQERLKHLVDIVDMARFFFVDALEYPPVDAMIPKKTQLSDVLDILKDTAAALQELPDYTEDALEALLREYTEKGSLKTGQVFMALRMALCASTVSPGLFETMAVLGRDRCVARLKQAMEYLAKHG